MAGDRRSAAQKMVNMVKICTLLRRQKVKTRFKTTRGLDLLKPAKFVATPKP